MSTESPGHPGDIRRLGGSWRKHPQREFCQLLRHLSIASFPAKRLNRCLARPWSAPAAPQRAPGPLLGAALAAFPEQQPDGRAREGMYVPPGIDELALVATVDVVRQVHPQREAGWRDSDLQRALDAQWHTARGGGT